MNAFTTTVVLIITFSFGALVGETWAPISGISTQALAARCAAIEARVQTLESKYRALKTEIEEDCVRITVDEGGGLNKKP